jgi:hypothetical protein
VIPVKNAWQTNKEIFSIQILPALPSVKRRIYGFLEKNLIINSFSLDKKILILVKSHNFIPHLGS